MTGYSVEIRETSTELTAKQRIQLKDTTDCVKLDSATESGEVILDIAYYAVIAIHNENSEDKDYENYILVDKNGTRYVTGSESFFSSFKSIYDEMKNETEEWQLKVYRMPSKKREGKYFLTCSVV